MRLIDEQYLATPFYGSRRMTAWLARRGEIANRKRVQRLMRIMGLEAIHPGPKTTNRNPDHEIHPYLLRGVTIDRRDQVWSTDVTYLPLEDGYMFLAAVIDWRSRFVLSWRLSNTLDGRFCLDALNAALKGGRPEIFNTDQGSQFTAKAFTGRLKKEGVAISMDGRGRALDNVFVERLWRSLKKEPTTTTCRRRRCRSGYNRGRGVSVGLARSGPLLSRASRRRRRSCTMLDQPASIPPRA